MAVNVAANLSVVRERIANAARAANRDPSSVRLVAVSKKHVPEAIRAAYAAGQRDFAENYVQELATKAEALADLTDLRWHFIGHLQRNKAKVVAALGAAIQTVDSIRLAEALAKASTPDAPLEVHVQVNVAGEAQKSGCATEELAAIVDAIRALPSLRLVGLMTIPPEGDERAGRAAFRELARLAKLHGLESLSMGMSEDLEVAISEGATTVRVGTAIFGERI